MFKKWMGVALLAGWLGGGAVAEAQYLPGAGLPPGVPDPLPCAPPQVPPLAGGPPAAPPQVPPLAGGIPGVPPPASKGKGKGRDPGELVPGPISPWAAPPGPGDDLSLPADIPNAFPCDECPKPTRVYFHA